MRMKEQYDPHAYEIGAACPWVSEEHPTLLALIVDNMVIVPDVMGPYRDKELGPYRIDVKPW